MQLKMITEEMKRHAVIVALHAGNEAPEVATFLKVDRSFVYKVKRSLDESGGDVQSVAKRKKHSRRSDAIRDDDFIAKVQNIVGDDPSKSIRAIARELQVHHKTVWRCIHEDLRYSSYVMRRGQFMTQQTKENRYEKSKKLLCEIKHPEEPKMLWFFSDEKNFDQDQKVNRRNDRWLCQDPEDVPHVMHTKFPATVMVLSVVSNQGDVMPPHFFKKGHRVNAEEYVKVLRDVVKPWIDRVAEGRPYVFQQDSAPAHKAKATQEWMSANLHSHITPEFWPPNSPDLNPLDYYVWGVVERDTNKCPHNTLDSLKSAIKQVMVKMDKAMLTKACARFRPRIEAVIAAEGGFIE